MKKIVIPGEKIEEKSNGETYEEKKGEETERRSKRYGMLYKNNGRGKIIPLKTKYIPQKRDKVIGVVSSVKYGGYVVDLNSPYDAFLSSDEADGEYEIKDLVSVEIQNVDEVNDPSIQNGRKFYGGTMIEINPAVTERVIGKNASMISMIKEKTGSKIFVGANGRIWIKGGDSRETEKATRKIEEQAHETGLTEKIKKYLEQGSD
ncbi:MAG: KH domain-containing protein [archaeon]